MEKTMTCQDSKEITIVAKFSHMFPEYGNENLILKH